MRKDPASYSAGFPVGEATVVYTFHPVVLKTPDRITDLELKVTAPSSGTDLPIIVLSHGHGPSNFIPSFYGYGPLVDFWAAHGFVVVQPTHPDATFLDLRGAENDDSPLYFDARANDLVTILDRLEEIEAAVGGLAGRLDKSRIAAVGHSAGGHTIGMVSGASVADSSGTLTVTNADDRIKARVMIAPPGKGNGLADGASRGYPALAQTTFETMAPPVLVVVGDNDSNAFFSGRSDWRSDAYSDAPSPKTLLTVFEAGHMFGGISSFDASETSDENPDRVAAVRALIWGYLRSELYDGDSSWTDMIEVLASSQNPAGKVETK